MAELAQAHQLFWVLKAIVWTSLVFFGFRFRLFSTYPLVYTYILTSMLFETVMLFLASWFGLTSIYYSYAYVGVSLFTLSLASLILLKIYSVLKPIRLKSDWHLVVIPTVVFFLGFVDSRSLWIFFRLIDIAYTILTYLGAMTVIRMIRQRRKVVLGWNLKMVLLALTIPACLHSLVIVAFTIDSSISYQSLTYWTKATAVASWIILAVGMSEYSPPRRLDRSEPIRDESGGESRERTAGNILEEKSYVALVELPAGRGRRRGGVVGMGADDRTTLRPTGTGTG